MGQCVPQRTSGGQRTPFRVLSLLPIGSRNGLRLWAYGASQQFRSSFQSHFFRELSLVLPSQKLFAYKTLAEYST